MHGVRGLHDVGVGNDVALLIPDEAGTLAQVAQHRIVAVAERVDLHHRGIPAGVDVHQHRGFVVHLDCFQGFGIHDDVERPGFRYRYLDLDPFGTDIRK